MKHRDLIKQLEQSGCRLIRHGGKHVGGITKERDMLAEQIQSEALKLKPIEKIHLAELLLISLDKPDETVEQKWVEESEKRYKAYKKGLIQGVPLEQFSPATKY
jgi:putative addiction module component (TIGR02574 family)